MNKTEEQLGIDEKIKDFKEDDVQLEVKVRQLEEDVRLLKEERKTEEHDKRLYFNEKLNEVFDTDPTYIPKTFPQQFCLYDTGGVRRLYIFVNGNWRYCVLS